MREESIVVAPGAQRADTDSLNAKLASLVGEDSAQVDRGRLSRIPSRQLLIDVWADLVAFATDRRTEVHARVVEAMTRGLHHREADLEDARHRSPPAGMQHLCRSGWMRDENGNAVGNGHRHRRSMLRREMAIGFAAPQPAVPMALVRENMVAVNLASRGEPRRGLVQLAAQRRPSPHHF